LKPTIEIIRTLCTCDSFDRGIQYFKEGRVQKLNLSGGVVNAMVKGTRRYRVKIEIDHYLMSTCTCPYDYEGYCKHIVAALLALAEDYQRTISRGEAEEKRIASALQGIDAERLRDFLKKEFVRNKAVQSHFMIYAAGEVERGEKSVRDYKKEIDALIEDASEDGYVEYRNEIDFNAFMDLAERYTEKENFVEAAKVYQALSEVMAEKMDKVDGSFDYYADRHWEALQYLPHCVNSMERESKSGYLDYLFDKFMGKEPDYFQDDYDEALRKICTTKDDLEHLKKLLSPCLPNSLPDSKEDWNRYYDSRVLLDMQVFVLEGLAKLGDEESRRGLHELFKRNYLKNEGFCLLYSERLEKDGMIDEAIKVAEEGIQAFQPRLARRLRLFLSRHYETLSPEKHKENLKMLFLQTIDWSFYEKLKKMSGEQWNSVLREMVEHFSSRNGDGRFEERTTIIEIYLREDMFEAALKEALARKSLRILSMYYRHLAEKFPTNYFNAYRELLLTFADARMGRDHYRKVVSELEKMKAIKGFDKEFEKYVEMLREMYARRPAFIDEMKRL